MKLIFSGFVNKQREIRDLKKQLYSIREENKNLKNSFALEKKNFIMTTKENLRNGVVLFLKSIVNSFTLKSKRIEILNVEIEALRTENKALQLKKQNFDYIIQSLQLSLEPSSLNLAFKNESLNLNINDLKFQKSQRDLDREWSKINASYHSQGTVDRAQR